MSECKLDDGSGQLTVWRIEDFEKVLIDEDEIGQFYDGDSYIVLYAYKKPPSSTKQYIIYFWQGRYSTTDEVGASAILAAQLDEELGGTPIEVRVTQGKEPGHFRSLFKGEMIIHSGGVASGFKNVKSRDEEDTDGCRLYHVKGTTEDNTYAIAVTEDAESLNSSSCFVWIYHDSAYLWKGRYCDDYEYEAASKISNKLFGEGAVTVEEGSESDEFWETLGGKKEYAELAPDAELPSAPRLCKCSDAYGSFEVEPIEPFTQEDLSVDDIMILDVGTELYIWVGSNSNYNERAKARESTEKYLEVSTDPKHVDVSIVTMKEGEEPLIFTQWFDDWDDDLLTSKQNFVDVYEARLQEKKEASENNAIDDQDTTTPISKQATEFWMKKDKSTKFKYSMGWGWKQSKKKINTTEDDDSSIDYVELHAKQVAHDLTLNDSNGNIKMWRIEDLEKVEIDSDCVGMFYDGDSYIVLYTYEAPPSSSKQYIIYFWQGRYSTTDEVGASAILAAQLDEELGGTPIEVRVTQGKEPGHFRSLFKGEMIIHSGGVASGFKNVKSRDEEDTDGCRLYHVKGTTEDNTYAIAVTEDAESLNSSSCFVWIYHDSAYLWKGRYCDDYEYEAASKISNKLFGEGAVTVEEGSESDEFWETLGGKKEYAELAPDAELPSAPRLFKCSDAYGSFEVEPIEPFTQEDLSVDDIMILDVGTSLYVWIGSGANKNERTKSYDSAGKYLKASPIERGHDIPIVTVTATLEPVIFTQWFDDWDPDLAAKNVFVDPYKEKLEQKAKEEEEEEEAVAEDEPQSKDEAVQSGNEDECDPAHRENLLSDEEFMDTFNMSRDEFKALAHWRQIQKKKEVGLF